MRSSLLNTCSDDITNLVSLQQFILTKHEFVHVPGKQGKSETHSAVEVKKKPKGSELRELDVLDPLSVLDYLFNKIKISIPDALVQQYWSHYRSPEIQSPWAMDHPASDHHIPLGLYGDACRIRPGEKMIGIFLSLPLWRPRSIRSSRFLLAAVR